MSQSTYALLMTLMVYGASAERISNVDSPSWSQRTTEGYGFNAGGSDRGSVTDSPRRFTYTWERSDAPATRSSYLDSFTTQRSYVAGGVGSDRNSDRDSYAAGYASSRRPSYQTDRWGDAIGGSVTDSPRSPYDSAYTTSRYGSSGSLDRDRTSAWGSGSRTTSRYGSPNRESSWGSAAGSRDRADSFDRNSAYLRIDAELLKLTNDKGLTSVGGKCDTFGQCDPVCYGFLDTERPNAEFPGSRDQKHWKKLFEAHDSNSPSFSNATESRDVCGVPYREANFRVYCEDKDTINSNDLINKWDCNIQRDPEGETFATWHSGECTPKFQADKMKLTFRYKIYTISRTRCDPTSGALAGPSTTTTRRRS